MTSPGQETHRGRGKIGRPALPGAAPSPSPVEVANGGQGYPLDVYRQLSVVLVVPVLDEAGKIGEVVSRAPRSLVDDVLVVDDGSTDGSREEAAAAGATVIALGRTSGVGAALRAGFERASAMGTHVVVVAAGNNKDAPEEIPRLLDPIVDDGADLVQGSRFLPPGGDLGDMPRYRRVAV